MAKKKSAPSAEPAAAPAPTEQPKPKAAPKFSVFRCTQGQRAARLFTAEAASAKPEDVTAARNAAEGYAQRMAKPLGKRSPVWFDVREER